jgi:hypothetical protein
MISSFPVSLPPGCVTGVGSLPYVDPDEAVTFVAEHCPQLPFWPQLPLRAAGEGVIVQGMGKLIEFLEPSTRPYCWTVRAGAHSEFAAGLEHSEPGLLPETAAGFFAFERAIEAGRFPLARAVKAQIEGPATLAHCLYVRDEPMSRSSESLDRLAAFLERQVAWQVRRLRTHGLPVILVLDEPTLTPAVVGHAGLGLANIISSIRRVLNAARREGAIVGLHCCAPLPFDLLTQLDIELLSFDAHLPIDEPGFVHVARTIAKRHGYLAYGLAPTGATGATIESMKHRWLALASLLENPSAVAGRSLVTATCGLGLSTPAEAVNSFTLARRMGALLSSYVSAADMQPEGAGSG